MSGQTPLLSEFYHEDSYRTLQGYQSKGGYETFKQALQRSPQSLVEEVKKSGLRGRGGAGFSAGQKWGFLPENGEPRFLINNADEGEPGTFKDRWIMERAPHQMIEGMLISAFAIQAKKSYVYIRGEYPQALRSVEKAIREAYDQGLLGVDILGTGFEHHMDVYSGAGAYICGEETGLLSSLEGKKGQPKLKPPFPAVQGYLGKPTIVNNTETLAAVVPIIRDGAEGYRRYGTEKSPGTKIFSLSGSVMKPGNYEVPLGYPLKDLIYDLGGGLAPGRRLKAVIPGGSSAPLLNADEAMNVNMDYESLSDMGSMLGSGAVIVIDDSHCMVEILKVILHFYHHESCGQCTPCREGTGWLEKLVGEIHDGQGRLQDIELLHRVSKNMMGKTICALSDAAALPTMSFVSKFREEFEFYVHEGFSMTGTNSSSYREDHV